MNKRTRLLTVIASSLLLVAGCSTGTHIATGKKRPPLKPEDVVLYQIPPEKFEYVGIVNSHSPGKRQGRMDSAVQVLKAHAAKMGANGIIIGNVDPGRESTSVGVGSGAAFASSGNAYGSAFSSGSAVGVSSSGIYLSGRAIYVRP